MSMDTAMYLGCAGQTYSLADTMTPYDAKKY